MLARRHRAWWTAYVCGVTVVLLALGWVSRQMLQLERAEAVARRDALHQERLRQALWRVDSWMMPRLAREAARPISDYRVETRSDPDLCRPAGRDDLASVYFELRPGGEVIILGPTAGVGGDLEVLLGSLRLELLLPEVRREEGWDAHGVGQSDVQTFDPGPPPPRQVAQSLGANDWEVRQELSRFAQNVQMVTSQQGGRAEPTPAPTPGALVGLWLGDPARPDDLHLCFLRRVAGGKGTWSLQGFLVDRQTLERQIRTRVGDLLPAAHLQPQGAGATGLEGRRLASLPATLEAPPPRPTPLPRLPTSALALAWTAVLLAIGATGWSLRSSIAHGEQRSRFASALTHELRTPLTTFRMYSEMLAEGMITDPGTRALYLTTLRDESSRLAMVVENVLAYARLEEGRGAPGPARLTLVDLLDRVLPPLERRCGTAGVPLEVVRGVSDTTQVLTDAEATGQILLNLVDNACAYGQGAAVTVRCRLDGPWVELQVSDQGPGLSRAARRRLFEPFARGAAAGEGGLGLGLSLSRDLARQLGGELTLDTADAGASFTLRVPRVDDQPSGSPSGSQTSAPA
jgi:signal transduction histidine kinase